jgi:SNF2 family DNA or RNA helicase
MYKDMKQDYVAYLGSKACVASMALIKGLRLQQILSGFFSDDDGGITRYADNPRMEVLRETLEDLVDSHKVIVWACFRENYGMISDMLNAEKIRHTFLYGGMTDKQRNENIISFTTDESCRVLVANQQAAGLGINLVQSSYSLYFSRNFSLEQDLQSEARNYRGGSEIHTKVTRIDLVTPRTIDAVILKALAAKKNIAENILGFRAELSKGI